MGFRPIIKSNHDDDYGEDALNILSAFGLQSTVQGEYDCDTIAIKLLQLLVSLIGPANITSNGTEVKIEQNEEGFYDFDYWPGNGSDEWESTMRAIAILANTASRLRQPNETIIIDDE